MTAAIILPRGQAVTTPAPRPTLVPVVGMAFVDKSAVWSAISCIDSIRAFVSENVDTAKINSLNEYLFIIRDALSTAIEDNVELEEILAELEEHILQKAEDLAESDSFSREDIVKAMKLSVKILIAYLPSQLKKVLKNFKL